MDSFRDRFDDLEDNIVLFIINKLFQVKILFRLSLVCKRFFKLVFRTDSLYIDLNDQSLYLDCLSFLERNQSVDLIEFNRQKLSPILRRFQEIKALKIDFRILATGLSTSSLSASGFQKILMSTSSLSASEFQKILIGFGINFEYCHVLMADSIHELNFSVKTEIGIDNMHHLSRDYLQQTLLWLTLILDAASTMHGLIIPFVLENKKLKNVVLSDEFRKLEVVMDGKQIEALRNKEEDSAAVPGRMAVMSREASTLCLPKLGYTMNNVLLVSVIADKDAEAVEEIVNFRNPMGCSGFTQCSWVAMKVENVKAIELPAVDFLDFKEGSLAVFQEAFGLLLEEIKVNP